MNVLDSVRDRNHAGLGTRNRLIEKFSAIYWIAIRMNKIVRLTKAHPH